jgi:hypothetical protein
MTEGVVDSGLVEEMVGSGVVEEVVWAVCSEMFIICPQQVELQNRKNDMLLL